MRCISRVLRALGAAAIAAAVTAAAAEADLKAWSGETPRLEAKDLNPRRVHLE